MAVDQPTREKMPLCAAALTTLCAETELKKLLEPDEQDIWGDGGTGGQFQSLGSLPVIPPNDVAEHALCYKPCT